MADDADSEFFFVERDDAAMEQHELLDDDAEDAENTFTHVHNGHIRCVIHRIESALRATFNSNDSMKKLRAVLFSCARSWKAQDLEGPAAHLAVCTFSHLDDSSLRTLAFSLRQGSQAAFPGNDSLVVDRNCLWTRQAVAARHGKGVLRQQRRGPFL